MIFLIKKYRFLFLAFIFTSCSNPQEKKPDTPTSGTLPVTADESFYPIAKAEVNAFENLYNNTRVIAAFKSEDEAINDLLNDRADMILISRELNAEEKEFIKRKKITFSTNQIATDAIALIVNDAYPDSLITTHQLKRIFNGTIKTWKELVSYLPDQEIKIVVDKSSSGNLRFLKDKLSLKPDAVQIYAAGSNEKVLEYIKNNSASIGVIGVNWISDEDDPELELKLQKIRVLAVAEGNEKDSSKFYQPLQSYLAEGTYPLTRPLFIINKNTKVGLGTGFASFILSDRGQRIILKAGLLPANMPGREIHINRNNL